MAAQMEAKRQLVQSLIEKLSQDIEKPDLDGKARQHILEQLKIHGRDPSGSDRIFSHEGLLILSNYAFGQYPDPVSQEAMRCIANTLLLEPSLRDPFVSHGSVSLVAERYQRQDNDYEFLSARILFLLTYNTIADFADLIESHQLIENIRDHLARHAATISKPNMRTGQIATMAMSESLKLVFNLANHVPSKTVDLSVCVPYIRDILLHTQIPPQPLEGTTGIILNALAILEFEAPCQTSVANEADQQCSNFISILVNILKSAVAQYQPLQLDVQAIPLITVLRKLYDSSTPSSKELLQKSLLPSTSERVLPLGKTSSLASQLLRFISEPGLSNLPDAVSGLLFELSDQDPAQFVRNIGYGYAAGYLMTHKIPIPEDLREIRKERNADDVPVNPITGQRLDKEEPADLPDMTLEEKEREAERLFVLFERLRATGVVDVKNPVGQAMEQGRFENVDSDSD